MEIFTGFPGGRLAMTPIPDLFFSAVLPAIDDLAELKVTLHVFWRLARLKREPRWLRLTDLGQDEVLLAGLPGPDPQAALRRGLERAVQRGTLLTLEFEVAGRTEQIYVANTAQGRRLIEQIRQAEIDFGQIVRGPEPVVRAVRPTIYELYERNIGVITPLLAEMLREAAAQYPAEWIEEAFRIAVANNRRQWRYIARILERWASEGRQDEAHRRYSPWPTAARTPRASS